MSSLPDFAGIVSTADRSGATYLPLEKLDVHVFIADVSARVILSQVYSHHGPDPLTEAFYVFPVPARAAVCGFELRTNNGAHLKGFVKELQEAKEEFKMAQSEGRLAGLLEQFFQDGKTIPYLVFVVSIGTIPPGVTVTILISYVVDLSEDDRPDKVRFQLSSHVRARCGAPMNSALYHGTAQSAPLSITVDIEISGPILAVESLNHNPFEDATPDTPTENELERGQQRHVTRRKFSSENIFDLRKDFLLIVHSDGIDKPRCFAEQLASEGNYSVSPTTALALTIVPRFEPHLMPSQEYIFLIDRSNSMKGSNIRMAKRALEVCLKSIPSNATFNVYSFASYSFSLWVRSRRYDDHTLTEATADVRNMDTNLGGGTELLSALKHVISARADNMPTNLFVLTDGGIFNVDETINWVNLAVSNAPHEAPIRVFTLGIGSGASTQVCQGLAAVGHGSNLMTIDGEDMASSVGRLFSAMQTPEVVDMSVDWGVSNQGVHQAPSRIPALSPGMRVLITAILSGEQVPKQITLKLRLSDGSSHDYQVGIQCLSHRIPLSFMDGLSGIPPLIHTLAAHLLIQEVENGSLHAHEFRDWDRLCPDDAGRKYIVELGTKYQIASRHTAFVAVAVPSLTENAPKQGKNVKRQRPPPSSNTGTGPEISQGDGTPDESNHGQNGGPSGTDSSSQKSDKHNGGNSKNLLASSQTKSLVSSKRHTSEPTRDNCKNSSPRANELSPQESTSKGPGGSDTTRPLTPIMPGGFGWSPDDTEHAGSSGIWDFVACKPSPNPREELCFFPDPHDGNPVIFTAPPPPYEKIIAVVSSWLLKPLRSIIFSRRQPGITTRAAKMAVSAFTRTQGPALPEEVLLVAKLQSSDGSFVNKLSELSHIVGVPLTRLRDSSPSPTSGICNETVWTAAIAVAFLRRRFGTTVEMWKDIAAKATRSGSLMCGGEEIFEEIIREAYELF